MISFIVAMDENRLIGGENKIPWHLPNDLKHFKTITMGHPIVMGRKTFESIGKPLPGRENIVLTANKNLSFNGCKVFHSELELIKYCHNIQDEVFVIGGAVLFQLFLPFVERLYLTKIHETFEGQVYFPELDYSQYKLVKREIGIKDEKNPYDYEFLLYEKMD